MLFLVIIAGSPSANASEYGDCKTRALIAAGAALAAENMPAYLKAIDQQSACNELIAKLPPDEARKVLKFNSDMDDLHRRALHNPAML
ncbi:hypothetical protein XH80_14640 [Bradyrhizobium sp. CCBAU 45384]|nr:hypothetical protein [Bradyrhizobium sp. CCBAU 45384]